MEHIRSTLYYFLSLRVYMECVSDGMWYVTHGNAYFLLFRGRITVLIAYVYSVFFSV